MGKLDTNYLGLTLSSPIVAGSSGITASIPKLQQLSAEGVGAIVLKSLFEEQIHNVAERLEAYGTDYPDAAEYIRAYTKSHGIQRYLDLIAQAKMMVDVPVIASLTCITASEWTEFAKQIEQAGADALELNLFFLPLSKDKKGAIYEQLYYDVLQQVRKVVRIPVAVKLGPGFTNPVNVVNELMIRKADGVVLFNKFYEPDIDIDKLQIVGGNVFSNPSDLRIPLRWVAVLSAQFPDLHISASTGVHDGAAVVKQLLAGATTVQMTSALYKNGPEYVGEMNRFVEQWMDKHGFATLADFRGMLNYAQIPNPELYERSQFMKYFGNKGDTM